MALKRASTWAADLGPQASVVRRLLKAGLWSFHMESAGAPAPMESNGGSWPGGPGSAVVAPTLEASSLSAS